MEAADVLRGTLLGLSQSTLVRDTLEKAPVSRSVVARYVPGTHIEDAVRAASELRDTNRLATIDFLGEDTMDRDQAEATRDAYVALLYLLSEHDLSRFGAAEVSLKLSALGQALPEDRKSVV